MAVDGVYLKILMVIIVKKLAENHQVDKIKILKEKFRKILVEILLLTLSIS
jgi:hypothetical protein